MKFICNGCTKQGEPCILDVGNDNSVTLDSLRCVLTDDHCCDWRKYEDGEVANPPKLTAGVFDRPDCPEWAHYAAVDKCGRAFYYQDFPARLSTFFLLSNQNGKSEEIKGKFNNHEWYNSLIERQAKLPEWCKVGEWVYTCGCDYRKVEEISDGIIYLSGGLNIPVGDIHSELVKARLRPYNVGEVPDLPFEVTERNSNFRTTVVSCDGDKVFLAGLFTAISTEKLMRDFTAKGNPCGVLQHIENGEWVK